MSGLVQIWRRFTAVSYAYIDSLELNRAQGIMKMTVGTVIGIWFGLFFIFTDPPSEETALVILLNIPFSNQMAAYLMICILSLFQWQLISNYVREGKLSQASQVYVLFLFLLAALAYIPGKMTNGTALVLSLPVTSAAVLLSQRNFLRVVLFVILLIVVIYVLNEAGLMEDISTSGFGNIDALIYGSIIVAVNGVILNVFLSGRNIIYAQNLALNAELEELVESERQQRATLQQAMNEYSQFTNHVASGDLTVRLALNSNVQSDVEQHGMSLNTMVQSLEIITQQVSEAVGELNATSSDILEVASEQSASMLQQDTAISETVATVEQINRTVEQTAERAKHVAELAQNTIDVSRRGQQAISEATNGMKAIQERVQDIVETTIMLSERTQQVGEIIESVNAIANQSKLLALNASIEASRAGESGRGFSIVAMEVRQLAEQSREATQKIQVILDEIQQATNAAVMVTEEGIKGADDGMSLVSVAGEAISLLAETIEESAQAATQIALSTQQQSSGMGQLNQAMLQIKQASAHSAVSTQQAEESAHTISRMANRLGDTIAHYQLSKNREQ